MMQHEIARTVAELMWSMEVNPLTGHAIDIKTIVEVIRYGYGEDAARSVRITVH